MIESEISIRVRYDEVDKMGYVYHGNYAKYFHISRTELLRETGLCDKTLETENIILPVVEMNIHYLKPVFYDDLIKIQTTLTEVSDVKMKFDHTVYNQSNKIINRARSAVVFVNEKTRSPRRVSKEILNKLNSNH